MRLGFAARSVARPELRSHDGRRWQNHPHLSVSLMYLRDMILYLAGARIGMYRMSSDLAPYATHPDLPQFHDQVAECRTELEAVGRLARTVQVRLSFHAAQHVVLSADDPVLAQRSADELTSLASILDAMGLGPPSVVVTHLGGTYGDRTNARSRFVDNLGLLPQAALQRLAVENDDTRFDVGDALWVHERSGLPIVFDVLHHRLHNSSALSLRPALAACLATWPVTVRPKVHFSSPRTELVVDKQPGIAMPRIHPPAWRNHSDYVNPFEFVDFLRLAEGLRAFDVLLEVKARDAALCRLRSDLERFAPDLAATVEPSAKDGKDG